MHSCLAVTVTEPGGHFGAPGALSFRSLQLRCHQNTVHGLRL